MPGPPWGRTSLEFAERQIAGPPCRQSQARSGRQRRRSDLVTRLAWELPAELSLPVGGEDRACKSPRVPIHSSRSSQQWLGVRRRLFDPQERGALHITPVLDQPRATRGAKWPPLWILLAGKEIHVLQPSDADIQVSCNSSVSRAPIS